MKSGRLSTIGDQLARLSGRSLKLQLFQSRDREGAGSVIGIYPTAVSNRPTGALRLKLYRETAQKKHYWPPMNADKRRSDRDLIGVNLRSSAANNVFSIAGVSR